MFDFPPELDFTSEYFDPAKALAAKDIFLPFPKAKTYNNLADWYSHTFKKNISTSQSKAASKNECFVLKRNYEWYYETLGLDMPDDFDFQSRYQKYTKRKRHSNGKYMIDKKVKVLEMPPEMLEPIRSSKILVKRSDGSLRNYVVISENNTNPGNENLLGCNDKTATNAVSGNSTVKENVGRLIPNESNVMDYSKSREPEIVSKKVKTAENPSNLKTLAIVSDDDRDSENRTQYVKRDKTTTALKIKNTGQKRDTNIKSQKINNSTSINISSVTNGSTQKEASSDTFSNMKTDIFTPFEMQNKKEIIVENQIIASSFEIKVARSESNGKNTSCAGISCEKNVSNHKNDLEKSSNLKSVSGISTVFKDDNSRKRIDSSKFGKLSKRCSDDSTSSSSSSLKSVSNKENSKELALLALARKARKRLLVQ